MSIYYFKDQREYTLRKIWKYSSYNKYYMLCTNFLSVVPWGNHISTRATATRLLGKSHENPHESQSWKKHHRIFKQNMSLAWLLLYHRKRPDLFYLLTYLLNIYVNVFYLCAFVFSEDQTQRTELKTFAN